MTKISEAFANAVEHHQAGQFETAEQIYRQILAVDPDNADALHLLGVIAYQIGKPEFAVECIVRAIELNRTEAAFHSNLGNAFKAQGKLDDAVDSYRRALQLKPDYAVAHYNLGSALQDQARLEEAVDCFRRALQLKPDYALAYNNLANALQAQGKLDEAVACFRRVTELHPDQYAAHYNLANALQTETRSEEAVASYRRAIELQPNHAETHSNLGAAFQSQGKLEAAVDSYRRALELKSDYAVGHYNLGTALLEQGKPDDAVSCFRRALELRPDLPEARTSLGNALQDLGMLEDAVNCYHRALELSPDYAEAHSNLGNVFQSQGEYAEALTCFRRALELKPDLPEAHNSLGTGFHTEGSLDEAANAYRRALELKPDYPEAHYNQSLLMLQRGDYDGGWPEYEWQWKCKEFKAEAIKGRRWDGSPVAGRVLLHAHQGLGDTLQFIRYAPFVRQRSEELLLRCSNRLMPLLSRCHGIDRLISQEAEPPTCDAEAHLTSLPLAFHTTLENIPQEVPYLFADSNLIQTWRARLPRDGFRVGIAWQGNPSFKHDKTRSIPLMEFGPLAEVPGVRLISLQKGYGSDQLADVKGHFDVAELSPDFDESAGAFMDTAAVMLNLELVITSDSATAHLAGGLGVPVWVGLAFIPEWRWLLDRHDSPWYPTMRLFRQRSPGNWPSVFEHMKAELDKRLSKLDST